MGQSEGSFAGLPYDRQNYTPGTRPAREVMLKHFSLDHKFVIIDNEDCWIEDVYRDEKGNLHLRIGRES